MSSLSPSRHRILVISHIQSRISKITERSRLHQIDTHQKRRRNLEARICTQLVKLDVLVEEQRRAELLDELDYHDGLMGASWFKKRIIVI